jgi:hypothetical protein
MLWLCVSMHSTQLTAWRPKADAIPPAVSLPAIDRRREVVDAFPQDVCAQDVWIVDDSGPRQRSRVQPIAWIQQCHQIASVEKDHGRLGVPYKYWSCWAAASPGESGFSGYRLANSASLRSGGLAEAAGATPAI